MLKNKATFYTLSFTWGIIMTLFGCIAAVVAILTGHKFKKYGYCLCFEVGNNWGGLDLGPVFFVSRSASEHTKNHEHGHALQNCLYGPLMLIISILSVCRYWYRELRYFQKGLVPPTEYDDAWYEGEATKFGTDFMSHSN